MPYMASKASFFFFQIFKISLKIQRENKPNSGHGFLTHHDGLNTLGRGSLKKQF